MSKKSIESAIKFIRTNAKRNEWTKRCSATFENDYCVYATDGYQVLRTLEEIDKSLIGKAEEKFMGICEKCFDSETYEYQTFESPDIEKLESEIKKLKSECKSKNRPLWKTHIGYAIAEDIIVNAEYLVNALKATGVEKFYGTGRTKPLMFYREETQYFLLPVWNDGGLKAGEIKIIQ